MRYVQYKNFYLNPRKPIELLDPTVSKFSKYRYTFTEEEALAKIWNRGEDIRLREDPRFWEVYGLGHFHLSNQCLANEILADQLWKGLWNGQELEKELARLDSLNASTFHIFCSADSRFTQNNGTLILNARPFIKIPTELQEQINLVLDKFLSLHQENIKPLTTQQINEQLIYLQENLGKEENIIDILESCLYRACRAKDI